MALDVSSRQNVLECPPAAVRRVAKAALADSGMRADLSVVLVDDAQMAELNERYRGQAGPTDVLAFPYAADGEHVEGEVIVNAERAVAEAASRGHSPEAELMLYVAHGVLHLLGCDDREPAQRRQMRARERAVLAQAGYEVDV